MKKSIFIFRRDLRLEDNTGLNAALASGSEVIPVFVIDHKLLERWSNADKRFAFLFQSLASLETAIRDRGGRLLILNGNPAGELDRLVSRLSGQDVEISRVFMNRDYTPLAQARDEQIRAVCAERGVRLEVHDDVLLNPPAAVLKDNGEPYVVFTPYFRRAATHYVAPPQGLSAGRFAEMPQEEGARLEQVSQVKQALELRLAGFEPGEKGAARLRERLPQLDDYAEARDIPASQQTSRLSAHLRFGTCSPRQFYHDVRSALGSDHPLLRQLYWRDFYYQVAWYFPRVYSGAFRQEYDRVPWQQDEVRLQKWKAGETGFPIVDAGMRELLETGYMHNRVRMVVASFLTKNLHLSWRAGEAHFAEHLVDHDPAVNNGNWQWAASTGCDAQPYFRVFNPWRQQSKFDKDCVYIQRWVPELQNYPARAIHGLEKQGDFYRPQIADLRSSAEYIKNAFKEAGQLASA